MARRESTIDPSESPTKGLAYEPPSAAGESRKAVVPRSGPAGQLLGDDVVGGRSGNTLPTLEVVLAYTSACGGDQEYWKDLWSRTAALVAEEGGSPAAPEGRAEDARRDPVQRRRLTPAAYRRLVPVLVSGAFCACLAAYRAGVRHGRTVIGHT